MLARRIPAREATCPVCKAALGQRRFDQLITFFCQECNYFWKFEPNRELPVGIKNSKVQHSICGCGRCGR